MTAFVGAGRAREKAAAQEHRGHGPLSSSKQYVIDFIGYYVFCRSGPCPRNASLPWAAPTGTHKLIDAIAPQFAARQRGVWMTGNLLPEYRHAD